MTELILIFLGAIFINNFVLAQFLGICPFVGVSKRVSDAVGMGSAVLFVMVMATVVTWILFKFVMVPLEIQYLKTIMFILVIASLVQLVEIVLQKFVPALYEALGIYLPLITTNCAILGLCVINIEKKFNIVDGKLDLLQSIVHAVGAAVGFTLALVLMAGIRERLETADIPESLKGAPIAFVVAGLMAIAFLGFTGMIKM
jgi:electron transport complex protein RnfA